MMRRPHQYTHNMWSLQHLIFTIIYYLGCTTLYRLHTPTVRIVDCILNERILILATPSTPHAYEALYCLCAHANYLLTVGCAREQGLMVQAGAGRPALSFATS